MALAETFLTTTTHSVYRPNIWAKETLKARESNLVLVPLVKRYDRDIQAKGQTVEIPNLSNLSANLKVANTPVTLNVVTETKTTITINQHYESSLMIEDIADIQSAYDMASEYNQKVGYALASKMDYFIAYNLTNSAGNNLGAYGTVLADATILLANKYLDDAKAPQGDRHLVVTPQGKMEMLLIDKYVRYDAMGVGGSGNPIKNGSIGEIYDIKVYMSQNLIVTAATPTQNNHLLFHREAMAIAVQRDIKYANQRKEEYMATLYVGSCLWGGIILRADHAVRIKS